MRRLSANGWIAGLVAGSAACAMVSPIAAVDIGVVAGVLVTYMIEIAELRLQVDDPGGAVSVHAGAGLWGLIAVGLFGHFADGTRGGHMLAQLVGVAALLGLHAAADLRSESAAEPLVPYRVDNDGDWQGMDIRELGAGAYPEFVVHADEFVPLRRPRPFSASRTPWSAQVLRLGVNLQQAVGAAAIKAHALDRAHADQLHADVVVASSMVGGGDEFGGGLLEIEARSSASTGWLGRARIRAGRRSRAAAHRRAEC